MVILKLFGLVAFFYLCWASDFSNEDSDTLSLKDFDYFKYLGTNGPYVKYSATGIDPLTPYGCDVDQVQMFSRHGASYPSKSKYQQFVDLVAKIKESNARGPLTFVSDYEMFMSETSAGKETTESLYSGVMQAYSYGLESKFKYRNLLEQYNSTNKLDIFVAASDRVQETALSFALGLIGNGAFDIIALSENPKFGANSITPACPSYSAHREANKAIGYSYFESVISGVVSRINEKSGTHLNLGEIELLFEMCAYETGAAGNSRFCQVFEVNDYVAYGYYQDVDNFYTLGPGNSLAPVVGSIFANASLTLLYDNSSAIYLSFTYHEQITALISSLRLFDGNLPRSYIPVNKPWSSSELSSMMAHIVIERLNCHNQRSVRLLINDAVVTIPNCQSSPGFSCPLESFKSYVKGNSQNFNQICLANASIPQYISFFWDNKSTGTTG